MKMTVMHPRSIIAFTLLSFFIHSANAIIYTGAFYTEDYLITQRPTQPDPVDQRYPASASGSLIGSLVTDGTLGIISSGIYGTGVNQHILGYSFTTTNPVYGSTDTSIPPPSPNVTLSELPTTYSCSVESMPPQLRPDGCGTWNYFSVRGEIGGLATPDSFTLLSSSLFYALLGADISVSNDGANWSRCSSYGIVCSVGGGRSFYQGPLVFTAVPTPTTIALLSLGLVGIRAVRRK
jgi:hypothetical protein